MEPEPVSRTRTWVPHRRWIFLVLLALLGSVGLGLLFARFGIADLHQALARLSLGGFALYLALSLAVRLAFSARWFLVARALGPAPGFARFLAARLAGDAVAALIPAGGLGGDPLRIALIYGRGVPGSTASTGVALDRLLEVIGNTLSSAVYVAVVSLTLTQTLREHAAVTFGLLLAFLIAPLIWLRLGKRPVTPVLPRRWLSARPWGQRWLDLVLRVEDDLMDITRRRPQLLLWGTLGSLLIEGLILLEYHALLSAFGLAVTWPVVLLMVITVGVVKVVPVPAGLGTLEGGQVALHAALRGRAELGFLAGLVLRVHETIWLLAGLLALWTQGLSLHRLPNLVGETPTASPSGVQA